MNLGAEVGGHKSSVHNTSQCLGPGTTSVTLLRFSQSVQILNCLGQTFYLSEKYFNLHATHCGKT